MDVMLLLAFACLTTALAIRAWHSLHGRERSRTDRDRGHEPITGAEMNSFLRDLYCTNDLIDRLRRESRT